VDAWQVAVNGELTGVGAGSVQKIVIELGSGFGQSGSSSVNLDLEGTTDPAFSSLREIDIIFDQNPTASPAIGYDGPFLTYILDGVPGQTNVLSGGGTGANPSDSSGSGVPYNTILNDGGGTNILYAGDATNTLNGIAGSNTLYDGGGTNTLNGGSGSDTLVGGGGGFNVLNGGAGNETLIGGGAGTNILNDGGGTNTIQGPATLNLSNGISVQGSGSGFTATNNASAPVTLTVSPDSAGNVTFSPGNNTFVGTAGPLTITGSPHLSLVKTGDGTQTLAGSSSYDGGTTIATGTLVVGSPNALPENSVVTLSGGTLDLAGQSLDSSITLAGTGTLINSSDTTANVAGPITGNITLAGGGATSISGQVSGTLIVADNQALAPATVVHCNGGTVDLSGQSLDESISLVGNGTLINSSATTAEFAGPITGGFAVGGSGDTTISGQIDGTDGLTKVGTGTVTLTAVNTYAGDTTVQDGWLRLSDNNHQILNLPPPGSAGIVPMDISVNLNLTGITNDGDTFNGGFDGNGRALSETLLGSTIALNGVRFNLGPSEADDVIQAQGQPVDVVFGQYAEVDLLAAAVGGSQADQTFEVDYTDCSSDLFTRTVNDWSTGSGSGGGGSSSGSFTMDHVNLSTGAASDDGTYQFDHISLPVDSTKTVSSVTLPNNSHVIVIGITGIALADTPTNLAATPAAAETMHLSWTAPSGAIAGYNVYRGQDAGGEATTPLNADPLPPDATTFDDATVVAGNSYSYVIQALGTEGGPIGVPSNEVAAATPTRGAVAQVDLFRKFNLPGMTADGATFSGGGLDGAGHALSADSLKAANLGFLIGAASGNDNDVVKATGQTIGLPSGRFTSLEMLATAANGNQAAQQFTLHLANGTTKQLTQSFSAWDSPQSYAGESVAASMSYANISGGTSSGTRDVYTYSFALPSREPAVSITLPNDPNLIVLGIRCRTANLLPPTTRIRILGTGGLDLGGTEQGSGGISGDPGGTIDLGGGTLSDGGGSPGGFGGTITGGGGRRIQTLSRGSD
jgi:fibronectin-binding autotransporter adhesin